MITIISSCTGAHKLANKTELCTEQFDSLGCQLCVFFQEKFLILLLRRFGEVLSGSKILLNKHTIKKVLCTFSSDKTFTSIREWRVVYKTKH